MSGYTVPFSSSPPSTPGRKPYANGNSAPRFSTFTAHPSTTPAGPPPSSAKSFTPAWPPPTSMIGSSRLGSGRSNGSHNFMSSPQRSSNSRSFKKVSSPGKAGSRLANSPLRKANPSDRASKAPGSGLRSATNYDDLYDDDNDDDDYTDEEDEDEEEQGGTDGYGEVDEESDEDQGLAAAAATGTKKNLDPTQSSMTRNRRLGEPSLEDSHMSNARGSMLGTSMAKVVERRGRLRAGTKGESAIPGMAKDFAKQLGIAKLVESDHVILETEKLVGQLYYEDGTHGVGMEEEGQQSTLNAALALVPEALCKLWQSCCNLEKRRSMDRVSDDMIGPHPGEPSFTKATYLCDLLLQLQHPPAARGGQALARSLILRASNSSDHAGVKTRSYPQMLVEWLDAHHNSLDRAVLNNEAQTPRSPDFWSLVFSTLLRGQILRVIHLLNSADFANAASAQDDGIFDGGYSKNQLSNIDIVIDRAVQLLRSCPVVQDADWDVCGNIWMIFRSRVEQNLEDLVTFAEGRGLDAKDSAFRADAFGSSALGASRSESKLPWTIYHNLKILYGLLLGGASEVMASAQDWVEAAMGLTIWWDGIDDDDVAVGNLADTRRSLRRSQPERVRTVELNAGAAYRRRLALAFRHVTESSDEESFQINPRSPIEVGLAAIFESSYDSVFAILHAWSLTIATATIEIASEAGWYQAGEDLFVTDRFDESDLMVLSYGQSDKASAVTKDKFLIDYARATFRREKIRTSRPGNDLEGWQFATQLLTRMDDTNLANNNIEELLKELSVETDERAGKLIQFCHSAGLEQLAAEFAERYADHLVATTSRYGTAIVYYAQAHSAPKLRSVLALLVTLCLVHSCAYPPTHQLDVHLADLLRSPRGAFHALASYDPEGAELLQTNLSGYATLRKFYDLRDEEVNLKPGQKPSMRKLARQRVMVEALLAVIASSADHIAGGLHDDTCDSVIAVDGLLALLGEAMPFVNQQDRILDMSQIMLLLATIEDLQTVSPRVYALCEDCLQATLSAQRKTGRRPLETREMMKKSLSASGSGSSFELVGSELLQMADNDVEMGDADGNVSAKKDLKSIKRGWDWRQGLKGDATGNDVIRILRLGLAKEVGKAWLDGE
ncbi:hypothetical protein MMC25_007383 [Agyrium rufum]|nr:hypothetical protein [Agyrium rufum]